MISYGKVQVRCKEVNSFLFSTDLKAFYSLSLFLELCIQPGLELFALLIY